jgi:beta-hydroxylase
MEFLNTWQFWLIAVFVASATYVNMRGDKRLSFVKQLRDHSSVTAPVNAFMYLFSAIPSKAYPDTDSFPELDEIRKHWKEIREEAIALSESGMIKAPDRNNDLGFNSFFNKGWTRFYLKWYDDNHPSAEKYTPFTTKLLHGIPSVKAAMFANLPPGGVLREHRDPYAGSLRYHLGLVTPNDDACYIMVDGKKYSWRDGEDVVFDETFLHEAHNETDHQRIILFCDIERPMNNPVATWVNRLFSNVFLKASASPNLDSDKTGLLNRIYQYVYYNVTMVFKRLKLWNRKVYYLVKYSLVSLILFLIFYPW